MRETTNIEEKLIESFKELALKEPVEKITIKEITDGAGVIRTTFYYHFQDKYELIERILQENLVDPIMSVVREGRVDDAILELMRTLDAEKPFYRRLSKMEGQNSFEEILTRDISAGLTDVIEHLSGGENKIALKGKYPWMTTKIISEYYARAMTFALITFLNMEPPAPAEEAAEVFDYVLRHTLNETLVEWYLK